MGSRPVIGGDVGRPHRPRGIGLPRELATIASFDTAEGSGELRGTVSIDETANFGITGALQLEFRNAGRLLALTGAKSRPALDGVPVAGNLQIALAGGKFDISTSRLGVADAALDGKVSIALLPAGGWQVDGAISASRFAVPAAFALLTEGRATKRADSGVPGQSVWSDNSFDLALLNNIVGKLRIDADTLEIAPGVLARKARLDLSRAKFGWAVRLSDATILGGKIGADIALEVAAAGAGLKLGGDIRLSDGRLEKAGATEATAPAAGPVNLALRVDGTALTPRGPCCCAQRQRRTLPRRNDAQPLRSDGHSPDGRRHHRRARRPPARRGAPEARAGSYGAATRIRHPLAKGTGRSLRKVWYASVPSRPKCPMGVSPVLRRSISTPCASTANGASTCGQ